MGATNQETWGGSGRWLNMWSNNSLSGHGCSKSAAASPSAPRKASTRNARYGLTNLITRCSMAMVRLSFFQNTKALVERRPILFAPAGLANFASHRLQMAGRLIEREV